jgi:hypothetical protein
MLVEIKNSRGEVMRLTNEEQQHADWVTRQLVDRFGNRFKNILGYEILVTTLTTIMSRISEQKFFRLPPAKYLPLRVGQGAYSDFLTTYRSFSIADAFETGIIDMGGNNSRLATASAAVDSITVPVFNWGKNIAWTIVEMEQAAKSGNWDLIAAKEKARKTNWDIGIQKVAFLGANGLNNAQGNCYGLLNLPGVVTNTTFLTNAISNLDPTDLKTFVQGIMEEFRLNNNRTAYPRLFIVPESDYNGMTSQASAQFPVKSVLHLLQDAFRETCMDPEFKILPCGYCDSATRGSAIPALNGQQIYMLHTMDEESIRMDIPVDYTSTLANSVDNFGLQNVGYGQFTGAYAYRPLEAYYFTFPASNLTTPG